MSSVDEAGSPWPVPAPPTEAVLRTHVHGTVFAARASVVDRLHAGDPLLLVPDLPGDDDEPPAVWVHVQGGVFAARASVVDRPRVVYTSDPVDDLPGVDDGPPGVWEHVQGGDVLGHVPVQVAAWLAPYMLGGGRCRASVVHVAGPETASWHRVEIELARG